MTEPQTLNAAVLDRLRREMADSGIDIISELVAMYRVDAPEMVTEMRRAQAVGEPEVVTRQAHGLKGSSANLGAELLAEHCNALETQARGGNLQGATALIDEIDAELKRLITALDELPEIAGQQ